MPADQVEPDRFCFEQDRLAELCRPRTARPREYVATNGLFGFDRLLKEYAGLPADEPLPWGMEHFLSFGDPAVFAGDRDCRLPCHLAATEEQAELLRRAGRPRVESVGSAYFYMRAALDRRFPDLPAVGERRGTLVFPDKSTTHKDLDFDRAAYAAKLAALPSAFHPIAVSIFWKDFDRGAHRPFEEAGLRVVTSGHPYDPLFLFRQYDLCRRFRYACSNKLATSFCLAVLAGCRWFHFPGGPARVQRKGKRAELFADDPTHRLPGKQACLAASPFPFDMSEKGEEESLVVQRSLARRYAGEECVRTPQELRELREECRAELSRGKAPSIHYVKSLWKWRRTPRDLSARWLLAGVDSDGWSDGRTRLTLPAADPPSGAELTFFTPRTPVRAKKGAAWTIRLDDGPAFPWRPRDGRFTLRLPAPAAGRTRPVEIVVGEEALPRGEAGRGAFRIERLRAVPAAAAKPPRGGEGDDVAEGALVVEVQAHQAFGVSVGRFGPVERLTPAVGTAPSQDAKIAPPSPTPSASKKAESQDGCGESPHPAFRSGR